MAFGFDGSGASPSPVARCAPLGMHSRPSAPLRSSNGRAANCEPLGRTVLDVCREPLIGIYWIALGVIELFLAIGHSDVPWRPWIAITGILSIVAGGVVVIFPVSSLFFLTIFLGFWLVIFGVMLVARGIALRSRARLTKPLAPSPAA